jgi:glycosyltransferase involved in cell wall biosynthesis
MSAHRRPKVLVIAEAANPEWVSVPLVGWSLASALRRVADVHVVTQSRNSAAIVRAGWEPGRDFTALDSEAVAAPMWNLTRRLGGASGVAWTLTTAMSVPSYYWFEHLLWQHLGDRLRAKEWDIVHRVTPLSPTTPSLIARRLVPLGIPFVVGPLNGGVAWPREFSEARRQEQEWLSYVRDAYRLLPGYRTMRDTAAAIVVGSQATWQQLGARWTGKAVYIPENAISAELLSSQVSKPSYQPLRVVFVGRLVPYKGADMLIEACAELIRVGKIRLEIIGDGPQKPLLQELIAQHGLGKGVSLLGWLDRSSVVERLGQSHVLGFPSIREFGGGVAIEAMAAGTVPIVVNYAGPAELVTEATGYLVPLGSRASIITNLRTQFARLVEDPGQLAAKSVSGRARIQRWFTWERKAEQMAEIYDWVLGRAPKPDYGMPFAD